MVNMDEKTLHPKV